MENNSPHSAHERARIAEHQIKTGHYNRKTGKPRMPVVPTVHEAAIIRRISRGYLQVTMRGERPPLYSYEDGAAIRNDKAKDLTPENFARMVRNGWIVPVKGESLVEDGPPQRYVVPKP